MGSGVHPSQSNERAVCNLLKENNLEVSVAVTVRHSVKFHRHGNELNELMQKERDVL